MFDPRDSAYAVNLTYDRHIIGREKRAPHRVFKRDFAGHIICMSVCLVCQINCVGGITLPARMLKVIFGRYNTGQRGI